jgi:hypothetical protein
VESAGGYLLALIPWWVPWGASRLGHVEVSPGGRPLEGFSAVFPVMGSPGRGHCG